MPRYFSGSNSDYLSPAGGDVAAIDPGGLAGFSVHAWVMTRGPINVAQTVLSMWSGTSDRAYLLDIGGTAGVNAVAWNLLGQDSTGYGGNAAFKVRSGVWAPIGGTFAANKPTMTYTEGVPTPGTLVGATTVNTNSQTLGFGHRFDTSLPLFGYLGPVALWNVELTPAEMLALAQGVSPLRIRRGNIMGYWKMNGGSSSEYDASGKWGNVLAMSGSVPTAPRSFEPWEIDRQSIYRRYPVLVNPNTVDSDTVYVDIQPSGVDAFFGTITDAATVPVTITPSGTDIFERTDAATVYVDIQPSGVDGVVHTDAATVRVSFTITYCEFYFKQAVMFIGTIENTWQGVAAQQWYSKATQQWYGDAGGTAVTVDGICT